MALSSSTLASESLQRGPILALLVISAGPALVSSILLWPVVVVAVAVVWLLAAKRNPERWRRPDWLRLGRRDTPILATTAAIILVASLALMLWKSHYQPDLRDFAARLPSRNLAQLILAGVIFAVLNAFSEEVVFRGLLLEMLKPRIGVITALVVQAVLFGAGHYGGIPRGFWGVAMATVYGFALGLLRWKSDGMGTCIAAHIFADATIYWMVVSAQ